jgi:hypothetical protein
MTACWYAMLMFSGHVQNTRPHSQHIARLSTRMSTLGRRSSNVPSFKAPLLASTTLSKPARMTRLSWPASARFAFLVLSLRR